MKKFLVITKNHPIEVMDVMNKLYEAVGNIDLGVFIGSPQFTAFQVEQIKKVPYMEGFYPAVRAYKKIDEFAGENVHTAIIVGTVDIEDLLDYDAIVGLDNPEIQDYKEFPQEFNTTNMTIADLRYSDIIFTKIDELIYFLRVLIAKGDRLNVNVQ